MQVERESDQRQKNADTANKHVKQASLNLDDIKGTVLFPWKSPLVMLLSQFFASSRNLLNLKTVVSTSWWIICKKTCWFGFSC